MREDDDERVEEKREKRCERLGRESLRKLMARQDLCPVEWQDAEEDCDEEDGTPMMR